MSGSGTAPKSEQGQEKEKAVNLRLQFAVYICGICSSGTSGIMWVAVPLWAVSLGAQPIVIGIALGSYTFLPLLFSIPGGALIDKLGPRRVIATFGIIVLCSLPLYPLLPWIPALICLQMVSGLSISMAWIATQTLVGQRMRGEAVYAGRLSFATRFGGMAGPPLVGLMWDLAGPWGAFPFIALWTTGMLAGVALLPHNRDRNSDAPRRPPLRPSDFIPRLSAYGQAFRLLGIPAILLVVVTSLMRQSGQGMQNSFYIVYLKDLGFTGTAIGTLMSSFLVAGATGALLVGRLVRYVNRYWLLVGTVTLSVTMVTIAPLLSAYFLLMAAIVVRGASIGVMQPLMLSIMSQSAERTDQGKAVGLRATANRMAMTIMPVIMGGTVELVGLHHAFFVIGSILITILIVIAIAVNRSPVFRQGSHPG